MKLKFLKVTLLVVLITSLVAFIVLYNVGSIQIVYSQSQQSISGTGSMFPTFPKSNLPTPAQRAQETVAKPMMKTYPDGIFFFNSRYLGHTLQRGDIVSFENSKTKEVSRELYGDESGYIKRIIGLPGEKIMFREGNVYINDQVLDEPYIAKPRSTYGSTETPDCKPLTIPENKYFVMGDNRKSSYDSRYEIGYIDNNHILNYLSLQDQKGKYDDNWRDTSNDQSESSKIKLDIDAYLEKLNNLRRSEGVPTLQRNPQLENAAKTRGKEIIKLKQENVDKEGLANAIRDSGYVDNLWAETFIQGYYEADELIEALINQPESKELLLDEKYQDIGVSEVELTVDNCPQKVIVQHFGGYSPPDYSDETVKNITDAVSRLNTIKPGWESLKSNQRFYNQHSTDVDRINEIINIRLSNLNPIAQKIQSKQWLSPKEEDYIENKDPNLAKEQEDLANKLNNLITNF